MQEKNIAKIGGSSLGRRVFQFAKLAAQQMNPFESLFQDYQPTVFCVPTVGFVATATRSPWWWRIEAQ